MQITRSGVTYADNSLIGYNYGMANGLDDVISQLDSIVGPDLSEGTMTLESDTLVYDCWNRLVAVENADGTFIKGYGYDGLGRRTREITMVDHALVTTDLYYSSSWQVLETFAVGQGGGQAAERYVYSPVYVNAVVLRDDDTDADGTVDRRLYATCDANFNTTTVLDSSGNIQEHFVYDAYGSKIVTNGDWTVQSGDTLGWENTYQGGREDLVTGLINFQQRDYNPRTMTWNSADPLVYVDGMNRQRFDAANPINFTDPNGTWTYDPDMGTFSGTLGALPSDLSGVGSGFRLQFNPDEAAFEGNRQSRWDKKCPTTKINFVQIYYFDYSSRYLGIPPQGVFGTKLAVKSWTLDTADKAYPYYLENDASGVRNPSRGMSSDMPDTPRQPSSWKYESFEYKFETAAISAEGPDKGHVYGSIKWGFSMKRDIAGNFQWTRYVNNRTWSSVGPSVDAQEMKPRFGRIPAHLINVKLGGAYGAQGWNFSSIKPEEPSFEMGLALTAAGL